MNFYFSFCDTNGVILSTCCKPLSAVCVYTALHLISLKIQGLEEIAGVSNYLHKLVICPENEE